MNLAESSSGQLGNGTQITGSICWRTNSDQLLLNLPNYPSKCKKVGQVHYEASQCKLALKYICIDNKYVTCLFVQ